MFYKALIFTMSLLPLTSSSRAETSASQLIGAWNPAPLPVPPLAPSPAWTVTGGPCWTLRLNGDYSASVSGGFSVAYNSSDGDIEGFYFNVVTTGTAAWSHEAGIVTLEAVRLHFGPAMDAIVAGTFAYLNWIDEGPDRETLNVAIGADGPSSDVALAPGPGPMLDEGKALKTRVMDVLEDYARTIAAGPHRLRVDRIDRGQWAGRMLDDAKPGDFLSRRPTRQTCDYGAPF